MKRRYNDEGRESVLCMSPSRIIGRTIDRHLVRDSYIQEGWKEPGGDRVTMSFDEPIQA